MKKLEPHEVQLAIQFSEQLADAELWIGKAEELLSAARILEVDVVQYWSEIHVNEGRVISVPRRKNVSQGFCACLQPLTSSLWRDHRWQAT